MKRKSGFTSVRILTAVALTGSFCLGGFGQIVRATRNQAAETSAKAPRPADLLLSKYGTDLTMLARQGQLERVNGYKREINQLLKSLRQETDLSPVFIEQLEGVNATSIVNGVAQRIVAEPSSTSTTEKRIFALSLDRLSHGINSPEAFAARANAVLNEAIASNGQYVLFITDLHQLVGSYANPQVSNAIRNALEQRQIRIIAAATEQTFDENVASDSSLADLFQTIRLDDANSDSAEETEENDTAAQFSGEKISSDLQELVLNSGAKKSVEVILQATDINDPELVSLLRKNGAVVKERLPELDTLTVSLPAGTIEKLGSSNLTNHLSPNRALNSFGHITTTTGTDQIRNNTIGSLIGGLLTLKPFIIDGTGIGIAVLDSGVDLKHVTIAGSVTFKRDFTNENKPDNDGYGHGTHVASAATGNSPTSDKKYEGIAPNAKVINLKVLDSRGVGTTSTVLNALNWILTPEDPSKPLSSRNVLNKEKYGIRVVNLSLGAPAISSYRDDPLCRAARKLVDNGIVVVAAAGNNGKDANGTKIYGQIHSPGNEPSVITVGAANSLGTDVRTDDGIASYSSRGPTRSRSIDANGVKHYDNMIKPDVVAPGNKLVFAESDDGADKPNWLVKQFPELDSGFSSSDNKKLMYLSGTSMATPIVAGTAALLLQANPNLTPNMIKAILMYTAQPLAGYNMLEQGAGQVNVEGAVRVAKLVRTDLKSTTPTNSPFLTTSTAPTPQTTVAGKMFAWSQGLILNHSYVTGTNLLLKYQPIYSLGVVMGDGFVLGDGVVMGDGFVLGDGVVMGDNIMTSAGFVLGDGIVFMPNGLLLGDGVVMGDGFVLGDGVVMGDGFVVGDGVVMGDAAVQAMSARAMINGDDSPSMR